MLYIIQNDSQVPPGNIVDLPYIPAAVRHMYRGDALPAPGDADALIVLGGSMGANDDERHPFLSDLKEFVRKSVLAGVPYLGICLGGQILAAALGAPVRSNRWGELGTREITLTPEGGRDPLFQGLPDRFTTFQWHNDSFDIPRGAVLLASSTDCPHQAFRFENRAWGLQFHPEVTERILLDWCAADGLDAERTRTLHDRFLSGIRNYRQLSNRLIGNFLGTAGLIQK